MLSHQFIRQTHLTSFFAFHRPPREKSTTHQKTKKIVRAALRKLLARIINVTTLISNGSLSSARRKIALASG